MAWKLALDVIQDVRGSIAMYMFIVEEAVQTVGMSCYLLYKDEKWEECLQLATWIINTILANAIAFSETYGHLAYPLNMAYDTFFKSSYKNMETYIERCTAKIAEG